MNYNNKYKERSPKETINLIKAFFNKYNFKIIEKYETSIFKLNEDNIIYKITVELYYNDIYIMSAYGKGITKDFCLASGYAELYERFCNFSTFSNDFRLIKLLQDINYKNNNYYLAKDEKIENNFNKLITNEVIKNYYQYYYLIGQHQLDNKYYTVPYSSILDSTDKKYINPILLKSVGSSNGMAAGNSLEEALVQGISELFERYAIENLSSILQEGLYELDLDKVKISDNLKEVINIIETNNNKLHIFDLSYNTGHPVVLVMLADLNTNKIRTCLGSFPVIDIAIERTITELYQHSHNSDINSINNILYYRQLINKNLTLIKDIILQPISDTDIIPEDFLLNSIKVNDFNSKVFLNANNYSNIELLDYYKQLVKKYNINIYYRDNSLVNDFFAVHIYSNELSIVPDFKYNMPENIFKNSCNPEIQNLLIEQTKAFYSTFKINFELKNLFFKHFNLFKYFNPRSTSKIASIEFKLPNILIRNDCIEFYNLIKDTIYEKYFYDYLTLYRYKVIDKISFEKLKEFERLYNKQFTEHQWRICSSVKDLVKEILIPAFNEVYSEDILLNILKPFIDKSTNN